ncbi:MAG: hypothetical protein QOJ12_2381 [Thermoleophilales bacterium]|nr:hypothetical protein [Thermoleophilales bacterium]
MTSSRNFKTGAAASTALLAIAFAPAGIAQAKPAKHKAATVTGVVVHNNSLAHSFVVAERSGKLDAIHGPRQRPGKKVRVEVRKLANGTFAGRKVKALAHAKAATVKLHGVVSSDDPATHEIVISGVGSSIRVSDDPATTTGTAAPAVGSTVDATVEVEGDGQLRADDVTVVGQSQAFRIEGKVLAIDTQTRTLTISADDEGASAQSVDVTLPDTFDLAAFNVGECVELTVTQASDGSLTAVQSFGDDNSREADNHGHSGSGRGGPGGDQSDHQQEPGHSGNSGNSGSDHSGSGASASDPSASDPSASAPSGSAPSGSDTSGSDTSGSDGSHRHGR